MTRYLELENSVAALDLINDERLGEYSGKHVSVYFNPHDDEIGIVGTGVVIKGEMKKWIKSMCRF
jgi:hypothetical protein